MINYKTTEENLENYNSSAQKIVFEKPYPETEKHGKVKEAVIVQNRGGIGREEALFIEDQLFIEGLYRPAIFWRLAELSKNFEVKVDEV